VTGVGFRESDPSDMSDSSDSSDAR
jgi:hypothetical protein